MGERYLNAREDSLRKLTESTPQLRLVAGFSMLGNSQDRSISLGPSGSMPQRLYGNKVPNEKCRELLDDIWKNQVS